ncbi:MAG TPA: outer membrane protein assembly factor BamE, partial [Gammaproteobacteria bacterium]|nr:outer membrane protein assembly factor BamE [Gammaproteobacteria bacterium]
MSQFARLAALFLAFLLLPACTVYRLDIQQGNFIDQEMRDQLEVGMTREQVLFVMGTPMVKDP